MITIPLYQIDAFAVRAFSGNPAAVCPLREWLPDATLAAIAAENNLSETAFLVGSDGHYALRWFTPTTEVDLCGHATLASAFVVFERLEPGRGVVSFDTASGALTVRREDGFLLMDLPSRPPKPIPVPEALTKALGATPTEAGTSRDLMAVFDDDDAVRGLRPDFRALAELGQAAIVTAPGRDVDFVSRFFAPGDGIDEDPVTGSAHCTLIPYWAKRLGRADLRARQVSARGGDLACRDLGDRVSVGGRATLFLEGTIRV